jgi:hypothetical protein
MQKQQVLQCNADLAGAIHYCRSSRRYTVMQIQEVVHCNDEVAEKALHCNAEAAGVHCNAELAGATL